MNYLSSLVIALRAWVKSELEYILRIWIAIDAMVQASFRFGNIGVTISSRIGTAAAHGHRWGLIGWWLLDHTWPFGKDPVTGESHCKSAIENDIIRAKAAITELEDPIVQAYLKNLP